MGSQHYGEDRTVAVVDDELQYLMGETERNKSAERCGWCKGSKVDIYSNSLGKWFMGNIVEVEKHKYGCKYDTLTVQFYVDCRKCAGKGYRRRYNCAPCEHCWGSGKVC